jgi:hypothetical protein
MNNAIYYFSGTGNSLEIARTVSIAMENCSLTGIASLRGQNRVESQSQTIGLVFPLYFAGLPQMIVDFLKRVSFQDDGYLFAIVSAAYPWSGYVLHQLEGWLKKKNRALAAGYYMTTVENFLSKYVIPGQSEQAATREKRRKRACFCHPNHPGPIQSHRPGSDHTLIRHLPHVYGFAAPIQSSF